MNPRAFYDEYLRIAREFYPEATFDTLEEFRPKIESGQYYITNGKFPTGASPTFKDLELAFALMKSLIEKGIYGDRNDKSLGLVDPKTGERFNVYTRILKLIRTIDAQRMVVKRGTRGDKEFYNLPEWQEFYDLYYSLLLLLFVEIPPKPTGPKPGPPPPPPGSTLVRPPPKKINAVPLPPEQNQIKQQMSQEMFMRIPKNIVAPEPAPAPAPAPAPESYKREIEDFKNIFKQIKIGKVGFKGNTLDVIIIRPDYIELVRKAIYEKFGQETFNQITQISKGYKKLANLVRRIDRTTTERDLEIFIKEDYPRFNFKSLPLTPQFLTTMVELYEDEFINDLTKYLSAKEGGRRGLVGGGKWTTIVQRLVEKRLIPSERQAAINRQLGVLSAQGWKGEFGFKAKKKLILDEIKLHPEAGNKKRDVIDYFRDMKTDDDLLVFEAKLAYFFGRGKPRKCKKCGKNKKLVGGFGFDEIKPILRRAIKYIYNQGNNIAYYTALFAAGDLVNRLFRVENLEILLSRITGIFPRWFLRIILSIGTGLNIRKLVQLFIEPLNLRNANPQNEDPENIEIPPEPAWLKATLEKLEDNPGHLKQE